MKNSKNIITHLLENPSLSKIKEFHCFDKIKSLLPMYMQNAIEFIYKKDKTLFFVLNHPGFKMEFNYKITIIKRWLKDLKKLDKNCKELDIETLKAFVTNKVKINENMTTCSYYKELSNGEFRNNASLSEIYNIFEEIKQVIKNKENKT